MQGLIIQGREIGGTTELRVNEYSPQKRETPEVPTNVATVSVSP